MADSLMAYCDMVITDAKQFFGFNTYLTTVTTGTTAITVPPDSSDYPKNRYRTDLTFRAYNSLIGVFFFFAIELFPANTVIFRITIIGQP